MDYVIILVINLIVVLILKLVLGANIRKLKIKGSSKEIENLTDKFPRNIEICKYILRKFNKDVKIREDKDSNTSVYIVATNTIIIANIKSSCARIQTVIHECIHSTQNRKILMFNYIYSNLYNLYFIVLLILFITKNINNILLQLFIFLISSIIWFIIRAYLEVDAMIRAEYETKEYIKEKNIIGKEEQSKLIKYYKELNEIRNTNIYISLVFKNHTKNINILYNIINL